MKTSLNIPNADIQELMKNAGKSTRTEAVLLAIREFNRRRRMKNISQQLGTFANFIEVAELKRLRGLE